MVFGYHTGRGSGYHFRLVEGVRSGVGFKRPQKKHIKMPWSFILRLNELNSR